LRDHEAKIGKRKLCVNKIEDKSNFCSGYDSSAKDISSSDESDEEKFLPSDFITSIGERNPIISYSSEESSTSDNSSRNAVEGPGESLSDRTTNVNIIVNSSRCNSKSKVKPKSNVSVVPTRRSGRTRILNPKYYSDAYENQ